MSKQTLTAISNVAKSVGAVGKTGTNTAQNYKFRGVDAVINAVAPALREHGLVLYPEVLTANYDTAPNKSGGLNQIARLTVKYTAQAIDGEPIVSIVAAEAFDSGDKATAKAMSVAYRTYLIQLLCLPTDEPDPDESSYEVGVRPRAPRVSNNDEWMAKALAATSIDELKTVYLAAQKAGADEVTLGEIKKLKP